MTSDIEITAANGINTIFTNFKGTARLMQLSGNGTDLAIDNLSFQAIPEPGSGLLGFWGLIAVIRLGRHRSKDQINESIKLGETENFS